MMVETQPFVLRTVVSFAGGPTGFISVDTLTEDISTYAYMPLRNPPHMKLDRMIQEQGQAEVDVRFKSGTVPMIATALSARSITLSVKQ